MYKAENMELAEELSRYVHSLSYSKLDEVTVKEVKRRIIDSIGCAIGAINERPVRIARGIAADVRSSKPATLLGTRIKSSVDLATFVNSLMIRYFDYNDTYLSREPAHPSDNIGACISVAESEDCTGRDLILSTVIAYEIQCRLCDAADIRHRGWDHVNYGLVSVALASSRLMGLNANEMKEAVNIALNGHIAMRQVRAGELSMWKGASFANAARNAVFASLLARGGMTGPSPIFEGEMGFFKQVSGPFQIDINSFGGMNGKFKINETYIKYFPAEYHSQSAVWAALEIRKEIDSLDEIESVRVQTHEAGYTILGKDPEKWRPRTKETADHSLPYIVGMALIEGKIDNATYSPKKMNDEKVIDFLRKIEVEEDKNLSALYPDKGIANRIIVRLRSGREISKEVIIPKGHPMNPMSDEEIEQKFYSLVKRYIDRSTCKKVLDLLWHIEDLKDIRKITSLLSVR